MSGEAETTSEEIKSYYEDFSLNVGARDWLIPNLRHQQLRLLLADALETDAPDADGRRILDIGCGAGVMTSHLTRFGSVVGTDFSEAAIGLARRLVPEARFWAGTVEDLDMTGFDLITLFDVLEHVPAAERPAFLAEVRERLRDGGRMFVSTPYPAYTRARRERKDPTLQIVDEEVRLAELLLEAQAVGLHLVDYRAFDVFAGSPEYQVIVFRAGPETSAGAPHLRDPRLRRRSVLPWRLAQAARVLRSGDRPAARWFLEAVAPEVTS